MIEVMENRETLWLQTAMLFLWGALFILLALGLLPLEIFVPRWLMGALGIVTLLGGARLRGEMRAPEERTRTDEFLRVWIGPLVLLVLSVAFLWVGFGPGERHGTGPGLLGRRVTGEVETRVVFGVFGVLLGLLTFVAFRSTWRSQRDRHEHPLAEPRDPAESR